MSVSEYIIVTPFLIMNNSYSIPTIHSINVDAIATASEIVLKDLLFERSTAPKSLHWIGDEPVLIYDFKNIDKNLFVVSVDQFLMSKRRD